MTVIEWLLTVIGGCLMLEMAMMLRVCLLLEICLREIAKEDTANG